jgi:hypothetical protein
MSWLGSSQFGLRQRANRGASSVRLGETVLLLIFIRGIQQLVEGLTVKELAARYQLEKRRPANLAKHIPDARVSPA